MGKDQMRKHLRGSSPPHQQSHSMRRASTAMCGRPIACSKRCCNLLLDSRLARGTGFSSFPSRLDIRMGCCASSMKSSQYCMCIVSISGPYDFYHVGPVHHSLKKVLQPHRLSGALLLRLSSLGHWYETLPCLDISMGCYASSVLPTMQLGAAYADGTYGFELKVCRAMTIGLEA